ncbi:MAG: ABC transporter substrate-binding protein [Sneathiella sp.]|nr:ABC transporter substrate-binding protein [Sneathiella sp.]
MKYLKYLIIGFTISFLPSLALADGSIAMHGAPKYTPGFENFDYTNPEAPKGGTLRLAAFGGFDSLNPFIVRGNPAKGLGLVHQSLLSRSGDEPFSLYPGLASILNITHDRREMTLRLNASAKFSDGSPVTTDDVLFSWETLQTKGRPNHRQYYGEIERIDAIDKRDFTVYFKESAGRELPLIFGLMSILSKSHFDGKPFDQTTLTPPIGSGPYVIGDIEPGRRIVYQRNNNFWAKDLPAFKGRHNFDRIIFEYFRDTDVAFQALLAGDLDLYVETDPAKWVSFQQRKGITTETLTRKLPPEIIALVFNTRHAPFSDPAVREALTPLFDFKWVNENLLHGLYSRSDSFFQNTSLSGQHPAGDEVMSLLEPYLKTLPSDILEDENLFPTYQSPNDMRKALRKARKTLQKAGWELNTAGAMQNKSGEILEFEILLNDSRYQRILAHFIDYLSKIGINAKIRMMDSAGYQSRITDYDYDMMIAEWSMSLSPGNEQHFYWSSEAADTPGTRNYPGIKSEAVDEMIDRVIQATSPKELKYAVRALDRLLIRGRYFIPLYHTTDIWIYKREGITHPDLLPLKGFSTDSWYKLP